MTPPEFLVGLILAISLSGLLWTVAANLSRGDRAFAHPCCIECGAQLPSLSWLPVIGLFTSSHCPGCQRSEVPQRASFELLWIAYCLVAAVRVPNLQNFIEVILFAATLSVILLVDLRSRLVFVGVLLVGLVLAVIAAIADGPDAIATAVIGIVVGVLLVSILYGFNLALVRSASRSLVQTSDLFLAAVVGAMLRTSDTLQAVFFSVLIGASLLVARLLIRNSARGLRVPYGPMLCLGAMLALIY